MPIYEWPARTVCTLYSYIFQAYSARNNLCMHPRLLRILNKEVTRELFNILLFILGIVLVFSSARTPFLLPLRWRGLWLRVGHWPCRASASLFPRVEDTRRPARVSNFLGGISPIFPEKSKNSQIQIFRGWIGWQAYLLNHVSSLILFICYYITP